MAKGIVDSFCRGCVHLKSANGTNTLISCDYILHTEQRRPCPAGKGCTARVTRKQWREMKKEGAV